MTFKCGDALKSVEVPHLEGFIVGSGNEVSSIGGEGNAHDVRFMAFQDGFGLESGRVVEDDGVIGGSRGN